MLITPTSLNSDYTYFVIHTLIDITKTNVCRIDTAESSMVLKHNQQRNFDTYLQACNLRTQTFDIANPATNFVKVDKLFGQLYKGRQKVWSFYFGVEQPACLQSSMSEFGLLRGDLHGVPIITNLTETVKLNGPFIQTIGYNTNTIIEKINNTL